MMSRRKFLKMAGYAAIWPLLTPYSATEDDVSALIKTSNKLLKENVSVNLKRLLEQECWNTGKSINCEFEYESRKSLIKNVMPELLTVLKNAGRYEISMSAKENVTGIKIYGDRITLIMSKNPFTAQQLKDLLRLQNTVKNLFYDDPKQILNDGFEADVNCVGHYDSVKCLFQLQNVGKISGFINKYVPEIRPVKDEYFLEIRTPQKYRSIKTTLGDLLNVTLEAKNY